MRSRDEVVIGSYRYTLRENGWTVTHVDHDNKTPVTWPHTVEMIDRIRELESPQASSEPVAWALMRGDVPVDGFPPAFALPTDAFELQRVFRAEFVPLYAHPSAAAVPEAIKDEKGSPVIAYMVFDDDNTPVAFAREKDDAEFAVSELSSIEGALRVVACHFAAAITHPTTPTRGSDE